MQRLAAAERSTQQIKLLKNVLARRELVSAAEIEAEWSGVLRTVRAGVLAAPSRCQQRLPGLTAHDVAQIDAELRDVLTEIGNGA
jgi:phage terminase Nu1 subunit (DNA packaging protein)